MKSIFIFLSFIICTSCTFAQEIQTNSSSKNILNSPNVVPQAEGVTVSDTFDLENSIAKDRKEDRKYKSLQEPVQSGNKLSEESTLKKESSVSTKYQSSTQLFKASQYKSSHNPYSRSATPVEQQQMDDNLKEMETEAPNSFETNLYNYEASHYDSSKDTFLFRAAEQQPENTELRQQMSAYYFINDNISAADSITVKLVENGTLCSGQLNYSADLYNSMMSNSTLIVHGFNDLLPMIHQLNTTVSNTFFEVVSLDLLQSDDYKASLSEKGFVFPGSKVIDTAFLKEFIELNPSKNIQLSLTLPKEYFKQFLPDLYPVGLTFVTSKREEDEAVNIQLWQKEWDKNILLNGTGDWSDPWYTNYLPTLVSLKKHYQAIGNTAEADKINQVILAISNRNNLNPKTKKYTSK